MKITLEYRNPNLSHCDVAVFINGAMTGTLRLCQSEILSFQMIISNGIMESDTFLSRGNPNPEINHESDT